MKLGSLRRKLAILFGVICSLIALSPLLLWNTVQRDRIGDDAQRSLEGQLQQVQVADSRGAAEKVGFPAWYVSVVPQSEYVESRSSGDAIAGLPLERWLTESKGQPSFREIALDDNERYIGYVVPKFRLAANKVDAIRATLDRLIAANPGVRPEKLVSAHVEGDNGEGA